MKAPPLNPVLARELKERMRGRRPAVILTIYLTLLSLILWLVYQAATASQNDPFGPPVATQVASVGRSVFEWLLFVMLLIVLFLVPAQTAGAIAGERERQTLVPLQITLLSPRSILLGKIGAAMAFLVLLVVAAIPLLSIAYLIGGVTIAEVLGGTALTVAAGVCLGAMCASISTFARRVQSSTVLSYGLGLSLVIGTLVSYGAAGVLDQSRGSDPADPPGYLLLANPIATVGDLVGGSGFDDDPSPFDGMKELVDREEDQAFFEDQGFGGREILVEDGVPIEGDFDVIGGDVGFGGGQGLADGGDAGLPFWFWSLLTLFAMAVLSVLLAARRLRTPAVSER